jgi:hypothetical protein
LPRDTTLYEPDFEETYAAYPRHDAKAAAHPKWKAAARSIGPDVLLRHVVKYAKAVAGKDKKFIPMMATWLNQKRWLSENGVVADIAPPARSARYVLEREVFVDQRFRVRRFLDYIMPMARALDLRGADDGILARAVGKLLRVMEDESARCGNDTLPAGEMIQVLWAYLDWLRTQHYSDATTAVLDASSNSFSHFRGVMMSADAAGRDPISGRSRYI